MIGIIALYTLLMSLSVLFLDKQGFITLPESVTNTINDLMEEAPKAFNDIKEYVYKLSLPTEFELPHVMVELNETVVETPSNVIFKVYIYFKNENTYVQVLKNYISPHYYQTAEFVSVYYNHAKDSVSPYHHRVVLFVSPYYTNLTHSIAPYLDSAKGTVFIYVFKLGDVISPYYHKAIEITEPYVDATKIYTIEYYNSAISTTSNFYNDYLESYVSLFSKLPLIEDLKSHTDLLNLILLLVVIAYVFPKLIVKGFSALEYILKGFVKDTHELTEGISAQYKSSLTENNSDKFKTYYGEPDNEEMLNGESGSLSDGLYELENGSNRAKIDQEEGANISKGSNRTKKYTKQEQVNTGSNRIFIDYQEETDSKGISDDSIFSSWFNQSESITNVDSNTYPEFEVQEEKQEEEEKSVISERRELILLESKEDKITKITKDTFTSDSENKFDEIADSSSLELNEDVKKCGSLELELESDARELEGVLGVETSTPDNEQSNEATAELNSPEVAEGTTLSICSGTYRNVTNEQEQEDDDTRAPSESKLEESLEASLQKLLKSESLETPELSLVENDIEKLLEDSLLSEQHDQETKSINSHTRESLSGPRSRSSASSVSTRLLPSNLETLNLSSAAANAVTVTVKTHTASSSLASIKKLTEISASASRPPSSQKLKKPTNRDPNPLYNGNTADLFSDEEL